MGSLRPPALPQVLVGAADLLGASPQVGFGAVELLGAATLPQELLEVVDFSKALLKDVLGAAEVLEGNESPQVLVGALGLV